MKAVRRSQRSLAASTALLCTSVQAHSIGASYVLPLPASLYISGALIILAITFVVAIGFSTASSKPRSKLVRSAIMVPTGTVPLLRAIGVAGLILVLATGFFGTNSTYTNLSMTLFWVVFLVGLTYASALIGDLFAVMNPWRTLLEFVERASPTLLKPRSRAPERFGYYPALALFIVFTWIELFVRMRPLPLAILLLSYTAICCVGAWWMGLRAWLQYGEFFGVYFRLIGKLAPIEWLRVDKTHVAIRFRAPLIGLSAEPAERFSLVAFVAFMVSSMIYHGARETLPWVRFFWQDIHGLVLPWAGTDPFEARLFFEHLQLVYESLALLLSPLLLLALFLAALWCLRRLAKLDVEVNALARHFAFSLVPIALAYHACHYLTLLITQGTQIVRLTSDPFGFGWNVFGTSHFLADPLLVEPSVVWHGQVAIMILGHLTGVLVAHWQCLPLIESRIRIAISQLPLLLLTMALTTNGLFLLSQPLSSGHSAHTQHTESP